MLHVTNGDCAFGVVAGSGAEGEILSWADVLHDGPVPAKGTLEARVAWLGPAARPQLEARDAALGAADHVVLWFEHDLFDQLQLLEVLARVGDARTVEAIVIDRFLGALEPDEGPALWSRRRPVGTEARAAARDAWDAFTGPGPSAWTVDDSSWVLRHAGAALGRVQQDLPWTTDGLALTERRLIEPLRDGPATREKLFAAAADAEEAIFLGDTSAWWRLDELAAGDRPLIRGQTLRAGDGALTLTADGEAVLVGEADRVALRGFDRWLGGARVVAPGDLWRWDPARDRVVRA